MCSQMRETRWRYIYSQELSVVCSRDTLGQPDRRELQYSRNERSKAERQELLWHLWTEDDGWNQCDWVQNWLSVPDWRWNFLGQDTTKCNTVFDSQTWEWMYYLWSQSLWKKKRETYAFGLVIVEFMFVALLLLFLLLFPHASHTCPIIGSFSGILWFDSVNHYYSCSCDANVSIVSRFDIEVRSVIHRWNEQFQYRRVHLANNYREPPL